MGEVHAVGAAVQKRRDPRRANRIEQAMTDAIKDALARGVPLSDVNAYKRVIEEAREAEKAKG